MWKTGMRCLFSAAVLAVPAHARADGYVTPWVGLSAVTPTDNGRTAFGVTTGYMGGGVFGFEADFGYLPDVLGSRTTLVRETAITAFGNFILGVPIGGTHGAGVRPFVTGGIGLAHTHAETGTLVEVARSGNGFNYNLGGGMMGFFNQHVGLRGDVRYVRGLADTDRLQGVDLEPTLLRYWRVTGGVTFR
jgi:Outer membrane protein beta-barrel domain